MKFCRQFRLQAISFPQTTPSIPLSAALYSNKKIFRQENKKFYLVPGYETEIVPKKRGRKPKLGVQRRCLKRLAPKEAIPPEDLLAFSASYFSRFLVSPMSLAT